MGHMREKTKADIIMKNLSITRYIYIYIKETHAVTQSMTWSMLLRANKLYLKEKYVHIYCNLFSLNLIIIF